VVNGVRLSTAIHRPLNKKKFELWSTNKKVINAHVDIPLVDIGRPSYANAFEFGPRDFATGGGNFTLLPEFSSQLDLGRRADSRWALPQISSKFYMIII